MPVCRILFMERRSGSKSRTRWRSNSVTCCWQTRIMLLCHASVSASHHTIIIIIIVIIILWVPWSRASQHVVVISSIRFSGCVLQSAADQHSAVPVPRLADWRAVLRRYQRELILAYFTFSLFIFHSPCFLRCRRCNRKPEIVGGG